MYTDYVYGSPTNTNFRLVNYHGELYTNKEMVNKNALVRYNSALMNRGLHGTSGFMNNRLPVIEVPILWEVDVDDLERGNKKATEKSNKHANHAKHVRNVNGKKSQDESSTVVGEEKTLGSDSRKIKANKISRDKTVAVDEKTREDQDVGSPQKPNGKPKNNVVNRMDNRPKTNPRNKMDKTSSNTNGAEQVSTDDSSEESRISTDYKQLKTNANGRPLKKSRRAVDLDDDDVPESKGANKKSDNKSSDEGPSGEWVEDSEGTRNNLQPERKTRRSSDHNVQNLRGRATGNKTRDGKMTLVILGKSKKSVLDKTVDLPKGNRPDKRVEGETRSPTSTRDLSKDRDKQSSNWKNKRPSDGSKNNIPQDDSDGLSILHYRNYRRG